MPHRAPRNPLHGITLEAMLTFLVEQVGWEGMAREVNIRCFTFEPSVASSLKFLRRTPWARTKVEALYLRTKGGKDGEVPAAPVPDANLTSPTASKFLGAGGKDRSAMRAHAMNRSHAHFKSDNRAKV